MTKDDGFALKIASLNALAFSITVAGVTYIDARLKSHVAFGARVYPYGYAISLCGGPVLFVATLLVLAKASSWKIKATFPALLLAFMGLLALPFFRPEFPHGGISVWLIQCSLASLLTCYIHFLPFRPDWLASEDISAALKLERLKEYVVLWRTIAISMTIGYMIILLPWSNFIWNQSPHIVTDPAQAFVLSEFGATGMVGVSVYVLWGIIYESFRRAHDAADLVLQYKFQAPRALSPAAPSSAKSAGSVRNQVFISYSHKDQPWLDRLQTMLKPLVRSGAISVWAEPSIQPGDRWKEELQKALASTKVAVLLVSENFLGSDFIAREELPPLFTAAEQGKVKILWVYLSYCLYEATPIGEYQAVHEIKQPLDELPAVTQNRVLRDVAQAIQMAYTHGGPLRPGERSGSSPAERVPSDGPPD
jgi:hypothetical protein